MGFSGAVDGASMVEFLPSVQEFLDFIQQEDQKFKVIFC